MTLQAGPWVSMNSYNLNFPGKKETLRGGLIPISDPAGRRRRISWHTDSSAPPLSIVFPPLRQKYHKGCVRSILWSHRAIQCFLRTKVTQH